MKKILFLSAIAVLALSIACNKDKERTEQTFNVEIFYQVKNDSMEIATKSSDVTLFENLDFDFKASCESDYYDGGKMTLTNGNKIVPLMRKSGETHTHTFEDIKNGEYFLSVWSTTDFNTVGEGYEYSIGCRKITVNPNIHNTTLKFVFSDEDRLWKGFCMDGSIRFIEK